MSETAAQAARLRFPDIGLPAEVIFVPPFDIVFLENSEPAQIVCIAYNRIGHAAVEAAISSNGRRFISTGGKRHRKRRERDDMYEPWTKSRQFCCEKDAARSDPGRRISVHDPQAFHAVKPTPRTEVNRIWA